MVEACNLGAVCECQVSVHPFKKVVLTGGPGAGKTAVLEIVKKSFCQHIAVLPEAASIVFGGGFWRLESTSGRMSAQRAIYHLQLEMERLAADENKYAVALCDRGTLDGLAYWPGTETLFWSELKTQKESELNRYSAVIHLRTPSLERGYNLQNPVRIESATLAAEIDKKIEKAWEGHPRRFFIESQNDFLDKVQRTIEIIKGEMPECCRKHEIRI